MGPRTVAWFVVVLLLVIHGNEATVSVDTKLGRIIGSEKTITTQGQLFTLRTFLGIPYAKPPTGELRFEKPVPAEAFKEEFVATKHGPACSQIDSPVFEQYKLQSEDCLSLNIYVPVQSADQDTGHAVMVFVHGGGFEMGSGESYVSDQLAVQGNVIVVTINYRLGIFGFMSSGDENMPGNMGLFDQHLAFKWINKNIADFGGDANRVTIFGESAGGTSVLFQGLFPENKGLFNRIISESGVPTLGGAVNTIPKLQFDFVIKGFGCESDSVKQSIDCMKAKDTDTVLKDLFELMAKVAEDPANALFVHFLVTIDGEIIKADALPSKIGNLAKTDVLPSVEFFRSLDLLAGYNSDDGAFLLSVPGFLPISDLETFSPSREEFATQLIHMPIAFNFGAVVIPEVIRSLIISQYTDWSNPNAIDSYKNRYTELWTDIFFGNGANEYARMHANSTDNGNTYMYLFSASSLHAIKTPSWIKGANHGDELMFVFGFNDKLIHDFNSSLVFQPNDWEKDLSHKIIQYWSNFAKSGNPNEPVHVYPIWPRFEMNEQIAMNLDKDMSDDSPIQFFAAETTNFWTETVPTVMDAVNKVNESPDSSSKYGQGKNTGECDSDKGCDNN